MQSGSDIDTALEQQPARSGYERADHRGGHIADKIAEPEPPHQEHCDTGQQRGEAEKHKDIREI